MNTGLTSYFWLAAPLLTDTILLCAGLLFVIRLYLIEREFEEELIGFEKDYLRKRINFDFRPLPEEEWFLAPGFEYQVTTRSQYCRLDTLRKIVKWWSDD